MPLALTGCAGDDAVEGEGPVTVYISLPLRGASGGDGQDAADGARMALTDADGEAGGREVRAVFLDATEGAAANALWTPGQAAANARQATQDSTTIAYVGDFESGATRSSLPITNEARLLQVSPASSAVDLVAPFPGSDDVPDVQASGERTFGRVIPGDDAQARAAAGWATELGVRRAVTGAGDSDFGRQMSESFTSEAEELGVAVAKGLQQVAGADLLYAPTLSVPPGRYECVRLVQFLAAPESMFSDAVLSGDLRCFKSAYATSAALDPSQLPPAGQNFVERFRAEYGREPGRYVAYGYEAMAVVLDSLERAGDGSTDREAVIDAFFETEDRDSVLGTYSIDEVGDTTLDRLTGYTIENGRPQPVAGLTVP